jgi:hypothetical protein
VLDLPRETQDATGEMRRVVADQIKALNELSSLVSRSGRSVDVAQPASQRRVAEGGSRAVAAPQAGSAQPAASAPVSSAASIASASPAAPALPAPRPSATGQARIEAPRPASSNRVAPQGGTGDKRGWLSDLLTRASLDDDEETETSAAAASPVASPAPPPASAPSGRRTPAVAAAETGRIALDTISTDIARMIEHRTVVDLWERYRRGEPNLFDPRIYTPQGRTTFAEIQRRYRSEAEFRRSVDRYVGEFERLLGDLVKNDSDAKRTDAYLTSETGKVYTMLAHASGRFDGA